MRSDPYQIELISPGQETFDHVYTKHSKCETWASDTHIAVLGSGATLNCLAILEAGRLQNFACICKRSVSSRPVGPSSFNTFGLGSEDLGSWRTGTQSLPGICYMWSRTTNAEIIP